MHNFCAVCFLAVLVCLVVCVSATPEVTAEGAARAAVEQAKQSVTEVRARAQSELDKATIILKKVDSSKREAAQALSKAEKTATGNKEAEEIAAKVKILSAAVSTLYSEAKQMMDTAVSTLTELLASTKELDDKPDIQITANTDQADDYTVTNGEAATLKAQATELNGRITNAVQPISGFDSKADDMVKKAKEAQLKDAHVSVVVAVAKISTILGTANNIIGQIEEKEREVNGIVEQMQNDCTKLSQSNEVIKAQCQIANDALKSAQGAVDNAKRAKADIQTQKDTADAALTKVTAEKQEVSDAKKAVTAAEACVSAAELIVPKFNDALQTATNSVTNANDAKQKLVESLEKATSQKSTEQSKKKEETNLPVVEGTDSHQKDTTIQPTSKDSLTQSNNNTDILKEALTNSAQNVPTTALTGGKAPAPGAKNDSAMTVSVPLLVALIASAVLQ